MAATSCAGVVPSASRVAAVVGGGDRGLASSRVAPRPRVLATRRFSRSASALRSDLWGGDKQLPTPVAASPRRHGASSASPRASANSPPTVAATSVSADTIPLLTPYQMGPFSLTNRVVLAPMTRCRALGFVPQPAAAEYYAQRAVPGQLLIAEGTVVAQEGIGYPNVPGIYTREQVEAWKPIVKAVKAKGGVFFCQLWHAGRASHPDFQPGGALPVAPSAIPISSGDKVYTQTGAHDYPTPRAMTEADIRAAVQQFRMAARHAMEAGFDGVEIHGANGYLIEEFIKDGTNKRTDRYGGSIPNRVRFLVEVASAVVEEIGPLRTGVRLAPFSTFLSSADSTPVPTYVHATQCMNDLGLLYVHMLEARIDREGEAVTGRESLEPFRRVFSNTFIAAGGYTRESGNAAIASGAADLVAYGRRFLANPDLPRRFALDAPLNPYDRDTFYTFDQVKGYTDYPSLEDEASK
ncbi:hypothetical protein CLOM_g1726 [Closterium sp. NIES-68]|nr:hypothetical protein CLOM_g1726 [Closterium sp. NIES-68]GJP70596.1 hypothetical protein CLOP_g1517 [Closterium sp. NIES-67]